MQNQVDSWEWTFIITADTYFNADKEFPSMLTDEENLKRVIKMVSSTKFRNDKYDDLRRKRIMRSEYKDIIIDAEELMSDVQSTLQQ